jgi:hypothetical protein
VFDAFASTRLVSKGPDWTKPKKKRLVIACEKAEAIVARQATMSLQEELKTLKYGDAKLGPWVVWNDAPHVDLDIQRMLEDADRKGIAVVSGDWSGFDTTLPPWLFEYGAHILATWVEGGQWINAHIETLANSVRLLTPDRIYEPQPSSMKSGSGFTNMLGGILNLLILHYGEALQAYEIHGVTVQGDDFLCYGPGVTPEKIAEVASQFGMIANAGKELYVKGSCNYLQKLQIKGWYGGIFPAYRSLGSILSYERLSHSSKDWNAYSDIVRAIAQLENCAFHPCFEALVHYVASGDKFQLGKTMSATKVLRKATNAGLEDARTMHKTVTGEHFDESDWAHNAVNGVLRGETLPPLGTIERFRRVYGKRLAGMTLPG